MPGDLVERLETFLRARGDDLDGAKVVVVGVGYKLGSSDTTVTPARDVVRRLRERGAQPLYVDAGVPGFEVDGVPVTRVLASDLGVEPRLDAAVILSGDSSVALDVLAGATKLVLDAGGSRVMPGDTRGVLRL